MGGKLTLAWQLRPAPRTERNRDDGAAAVVNEKSVAIPAFAVVYESVGTFKSVGMQVASILHVGPHHFAAMLSHVVVSHARLMSAMGRK